MKKRLKPISVVLTALILSANVCHAMSQPQAGTSAGPAFEQRYPRYRLRAGDVLDVNFPFTVEFNQTVTVQPDGYINLRGIGDIRAQDKTTPEMADMLRSAVESAALMRESGADVEIVMRAGHVRWLRRSGWLDSDLNPLRGILYPPTDVGPPGLNQIVARPDWFKQLPLDLQHKIAARSIRPAAAGWLAPRVDGIRITTGRKIVNAAAGDRHLRITLNDGSRRNIDHALLATGYRVDISRYLFLSTELAQSLDCVEGYPQLGMGFESSVPGLHFLGAPAARSFGPLMRFVSGTGYAGPALVRAVLSDGVKRSAGEERSWTVMAGTHQSG